MKQWFVVQLTAGYEKKIKDEILKRVEERGLQESFGDIVIPEAKAMSYLASTDVSIEQLFPGYILVNLEPSPEVFRLITTVPRVVRFLGGSSPFPLSDVEVGRVMSQVKGEVVIERKDVSYEVGTEISILAGPFTGFSGVIHAVEEDKQKLVIMVSIFGRMTPVEVLFGQVKI